MVHAQFPPDDRQRPREPEPLPERPTPLLVPIIGVGLLVLLGLAVVLYVI